MTPNTIDREKALLRYEMTQKLRRIPPDARESSDRIICAALLLLDVVKSAKTISIYISKPEEVDTRSIIDLLWLENKIIIAPRLTGYHTLIHHAITSPSDFIRGSYGILEPSSSLPEYRKPADVYILPGLAFDRKGYRLGRGKGCYDRILAGLNIPNIALAYDEQIIAEVPHEPHDIKMDCIVTQKELIEITSPSLYNGKI